MTTILWKETQEALTVYSRSKNVWLRKVETAQGSYLEAKKITFGMRVLHFFGLGWRLPDVLDFISKCNNKIPAKAQQKLNKAIVHHNAHSLFRTKIHFELSKGTTKLPKLERNIESAMDFVKKNLVPENIAALRKTIDANILTLQEPYITVRNILKRFDQIESISIETKAMPLKARLQLAIYIECTLPRVAELAEFIPAQNELPKSLMPTKERSIVVMADEATSKLQRSGTFKKVYSAALVPLKRSQPLQAAVHARIQPERHQIAPTVQELEICYKLRNEKGFVAMHTFCRIPKKEAREFRVAFEEYDDTLLNVPKLSTEQTIDAAKQLIEALNTLHSKKIAHLDLKSENVLFRLRDNKITCAITDFGLSLRMDPKKPIPIKDHALSGGTYGTSTITAPELIGNTKFKATKEALEKLDAWALGILLYELINGESTPWHDILNVEELTKDLASQVVELVNQHIPPKLAALGDTPRDKFLQITYQLLNPDPTKRLSVAQALKAIS